jgi:hypothetical protein
MSKREKRVRVWEAPPYPKGAKQKLALFTVALILALSPIEYDSVTIPSTCALIRPHCPDNHRPVGSVIGRHDCERHSFLVARWLFAVKSMA